MNRNLYIVLVVLSLSNLCTRAQVGRVEDEDEEPWIWGSDNESTDSSTPSTVPLSTPTQGTTRDTGPSTTTAATTTEGTPRPCPGCQVTPEYNPVCGTDRITYNNMGIMRCSQLCGANVQLQFHGKCKPAK